MNHGLRTVRYFLVITMAVAAVTVVATPAHAASCTRTWTGQAGNGRWATAANWNDNKVPNANDDVCIGTGSSSVQVDGAEVQSLTLGTQLSVTAGNNFTITGNDALDSSVVGGALTMMDGKLETNKKLILIWSTISLNAVTSVFRNRGDVEVKAGVATFLGGGKVTNEGAFTVSAGLADFQYAGFENNGVASASGTGTLKFNGGDGGNSDDGPFETATRFTASGGGTLQFNGGRYRLFAGSTLDGDGTVIVSGGTVDVAGGYQVSGTTRLPANTYGVLNLNQLAASTNVLTQESGTIGGSATLTVRSLLTWAGGIQQGSGATVVASSARLVIAGAPTKQLADNRNLRHEGATGTVLPGGPVLVGGGTFPSAATFVNAGILDIDGPSTVYGNPGGTFVNTGTLNKVGSGTASMALPFTNQGQVMLRSGVLMVSGFGYRQTAGRTVLVGGSLASDRTVDLASGTLAGVGTLAASVTSSAVVSPGPVTPAGARGVLTVTGDYTQRAGGVLRIDVLGIAAGTDYDQLRMGGSATLGGTLGVVSAAGFVPKPSDRLDVVVATGRTGTFRNSLPGAAMPGRQRYRVAYNPTTASLRVMTLFVGLDAPTAGDGDPPDTTVVRTASGVMEGTNHALRLFTPAGALVQHRTLKQFFGLPVTDADVFDPKVAVDAIGAHRRVYVVALQTSRVTDATQWSRIYLAVSRSPDPKTLTAADWCPYFFSGKRDGAGIQSSWADYPGIGFGADTVTITTNQITFAGEAFSFAVIRAMNKLALENNAGGCPSSLPPVHSFQPSPVFNDFNVFGLQPVQHQTAPTGYAGTTNPVYLVNTVRGASSTYRVWRLRNLAGGAPPSPDVVEVVATSGYASPVLNAPQLDGVDDLDTSDTRIASTAGRGDVITVAHNTDCNVGGGATESCVRLLRFTVGQDAAGKPTAVGSGLTTLSGAPGEFLFHPGVAVDTAGRTVVVLLRSSATTHLSAAWTLLGPASTTADPLTPLNTGSCAKATSKPGKAASTGDYTGAGTDRSGSVFWIGAERATVITGVCHWQTSIGGITP
jgi:hypothetical protein